MLNPFVAALLGIAFAGRPAAGRPFNAGAVGHASVVKIYVTNQHADYAMPWQGGRQSSGSGTGFIIKGRRILTNAHLVADNRFLEVQKDGEAQRYRAAVRFVAHDCDLAVIEVVDPGFYVDTVPVTLAGELPALNDEVIVLGYPLGGDRLSVTRGVVSRKEYAEYAHSGIDQHLVLQVDAAINPGNSGGPVLFDGRVVGLAFQGLAWAENIGYAIPLPVLRHFLDDIADGAYHGYPELGAAYMNLRNDALRKALGVPAGRNGVAVTFVDDFGAAHGLLNTGDVLLAIDGHDIAEDGTIAIRGEKYLFAELLERKQWGDRITVNVWRDGSEQPVAIPLTNPSDPFAFRNEYDHRPEYVMVGGLVFSPLSRDLLRTVDRGSISANVQRLFYTLDYAKLDGLHHNRRAFVVLIQRLPHPVNTYMDVYQFGIVDAVDDRAIPDMRTFRDAVRNPAGPYLRIRFADSPDELVLDVAEANAAERDILRSYNVPAREHVEDAP